MCGPAAGLLGAVGSIGSIGLGIAGANAKEAGKQQQYAYELQQTMIHNQRVMDNAQKANLAYGNQIQGIEQRRYFNNQALVQQADAATMKNREAEGTVYASGMSSGFWGGGTMQDIYSEYLNKEARIAANADLKFKDADTAFAEQGKALYAQADDRINSMAPMSAPLAPQSTRGLDIANAVVGGIGGVAKGLEGMGQMDGFNFGGLA
jgi:hypothetical protein